MRSFFLTMAVLAVLPAFAGASPLSDYRSLFAPFSLADGSTRIGIRKFRQGGVTRYLAIDPASLKTSVIPEGETLPLKVSVASLAQTPYMRELALHRASRRRLQNDGLVHARGAAQGVFITADLCPSARPFEREMFAAVEAAGGGSAVPVAVAISGDWLLKHSSDLEWLTGEERAGRLAVTWVNHSRSHVYRPAEPLERNFLLTPGTDFGNEVTATEILLLERGIAPSAFFRFPGLVSDAATVAALLEMGLIPLGSNAWLAKGEKPTQGSIILVHGNGNEPKGIRLLLALFLEKRSRIRLLPVADAVLSGGHGEEMRREGTGEGLRKGPVPDR
jgi:hypothetical protein